MSLTHYIMSNDYQDILSTEDCVLAAFDAIDQQPARQELAEKYGPWYSMTDDQRWEHLHMANMAYHTL